MNLALQFIIIIIFISPEHVKTTRLIDFDENQLEFIRLGGIFSQTGIIENIGL